MHPWEWLRVAQDRPPHSQSRSSHVLIQFQEESQRKMVQISNIFSSLARSISIKNGRKSRLDVGREAADALVAKAARKNEMLLTSSDFVNANKSSNMTSAYSKKGQKGLNQDQFVIWEEFGCQEDMTFCGIFDGHGPWGHFVAKTVKKLMPSLLLCNWQETVSEYAPKPDGDEMESSGECHSLFDIWKKSYFKTCSAIDYQLSHLPGIDSFYSGSTALTIVRQGDLIIVANVGDSRAVLATTNDNEESKRITESNGRIHSSKDEPGVYRVWMPNGNTLQGPGLAISRAFGDYYLKDFGLISDPELTQRRITGRDQFVILATDGVWDVISNQEAVGIVSSTPERAESAKRLVEFAVCAWKRKRPGIAMDDISAICLFLQGSPMPFPVSLSCKCTR